MIEVKMKAPSGAIQTVRCLEVIEIDGKPYTGPTDSVSERLANIEGRVEALMRAVFDMGDESEPSEGE